MERTLACADISEDFPAKVTRKGKPAHDTLPTFPEPLFGHLCSLVPGEDRLAPLRIEHARTTKDIDLRLIGSVDKDFDFAPNADLLKSCHPHRVPTALPDPPQLQGPTLHTVDSTTADWGWVPAKATATG